MKLTESNRNRVARRHSSRSRPYDLRRKVLVNNFLRDQTPYTSKPNEKSETEEISYNEPLKEVPEIDSSNQSAMTSSDEPESSSDTDTENTSLAEPSKNYSPETKEFLHLISRRLKISENPKRNSPSTPRLTRSLLRLRSRATSSSESDNPTVKQTTNLQRICRKIKNRPQRSRTLHPLRSYPTFDRLNEIFESNQTSQPFLERLVAKRLRNRRRCGSRSNNKVKRNVLRKSISIRCRRMLKKLDIVSENSCSSNGSDQESPAVSSIVEKFVKTPTKQPTFTVRILDSANGSSSPNYLNPNEARVTRSHSLTIPPVFTNLKSSPSRRKSESFKFSSGIFSISALKSGSLL